MSNNNSSNNPWANIGQIYTTSSDPWGFTLTIPSVPAISKEKTFGCNCKKCKEHNEYAEPNQSDGSFICYSCRKGW